MTSIFNPALDILDEDSAEVLYQAEPKNELPILEILLRTALSNVSSDTKSDPLTILNLACGPCREAMLLNKFFKTRTNIVEQFAIDLRAPQIDLAQKKYKQTTEKLRLQKNHLVDGFLENTAAKFFADDLTRLQHCKVVPDQFDIVFIRHQNLFHDKQTWTRIFELALSSLKESGSLIFTSYFDREHLLSIQLLRSIGGHLQYCIKNNRSIPLKHKGMSIDRHIAIFQKKPHLPSISSI